MPPPPATLRLAVFSDSEHALAGLIVNDGGVVVVGRDDAVSCPLRPSEPGGGTTVLAGDGCRLTLEPGSGARTPAPGGGEQQPLTVRGTVRRNEDALEIEGRGAELTLPLPQALGSVRLAVSWPDHDRALVLSAARPAGAEGHDHDLVNAWVQDGPDSTAVADPRLSVTTLAGEVPVRVGIELWLEDEEGNYDYPRRATGHVLAPTAELRAGTLAVEAHPVAWGSGDGHDPGLYAIVRPAST